MHIHSQPTAPSVVWPLSTICHLMTSCACQPLPSCLSLSHTHTLLTHGLTQAKSCMWHLLPRPFCLLHSSFLPTLVLTPPFPIMIVLLNFIYRLFFSPMQASTSVVAPLLRSSSFHGGLIYIIVCPLSVPSHTLVHVHHLYIDHKQYANALTNVYYRCTFEAMVRFACKLVYTWKCINKQDKLLHSKGIQRCIDIPSWAEIRSYTLTGHFISYTLVVMGWSLFSFPFLELSESLMARIQQGAGNDSIMQLLPFMMWISQRSSTGCVMF